MSFEDSRTPEAMEAEESTEHRSSVVAGSSGAAPAPMDEVAARASWEQANNMQEMGDEFLKFDAAVHQSIINAGPWRKDPHYFKAIKISAVALLKMLLHAQSGREKEVR